MKSIAAVHADPGYELKSVVFFLVGNKKGVKWELSRLRRQKLTDKRQLTPDNFS
jgi:hypothetical protein